MDTASLDAPDRTIESNWSTAVGSGEELQLVFGQMPPRGHRLLAAVVVHVHKGQFRELFASNPDFLTKVRETTASAANADRDRTITDGTFPEARVLFERASVVGLTHNERDAELRFYRVSPAELHRTERGGPPPRIQGVLTVTMSTSEFASLMNDVVSQLS